MGRGLVWGKIPLNQTHNQRVTLQTQPNPVGGGEEPEVQEVGEVIHLDTARVVQLPVNYATKMVTLLIIVDNIKVVPKLGKDSENLIGVTHVSLTKINTLMNVPVWINNVINAILRIISL